MHHSFGLCSVSLLFLLPLAWTSDQPEVTIAQGTVRGLYKKSYLGNKPFSSFEGIPYAKPPQGKRRFKEPEPAEPWIGIYNATREPSRCLQLGNKLFKIEESFQNQNEVVGSEDCLYINIYTPKLPREGGNDKPLDVIAFMHGGAFIVLHGKVHNADYLLEKDVVLVTFNYRLGPLGFLSTEDSNVPGNNGLKDQTLALKWIKENIAAFGGNPNSVTIAGISAGATSSHLHLLSPLSKGLFKGAICMSGVSLSSWALSKTPKRNAMIFAELLGCPTNDTKRMVQCLQNRPAYHIAAATKQYLLQEKKDLIPFGPVVEPALPNSFISKKPEEIIPQKGAADVPIIFSYVPNEGVLFGLRVIDKPETWDQAISNLLSSDFSIPPELASKITQKVRGHYKIDNSTQGGLNLIKMYGDLRDLVIGKAAKLHASLYSSPVYIYKFSYRGELSHSKIFTDKNVGVIHGDDAIYIVGLDIIGRISTDPDIQVAKTMVDIWASFAANGSLDNNFVPVRSNLPKITYTDIEGPRDMKIVVADEIGEETFWDSVMESLQRHKGL